MGYRSLPVAWRRLPIPRAPAAASACAEALRQGRYAAAPLSTADLDEVAQLHEAAPAATRGIGACLCARACVIGSMWPI